MPLGREKRNLTTILSIGFTVISRRHAKDVEGRNAGDDASSIRGATGVRCVARLLPCAVATGRRAAPDPPGARRYTS